MGDDLKEKMKKGWLHVIVTFEIAGKPRKHVEESLSKFIENIRKDQRILFVQEEREEAIEHEDGVFSAYSEAELLVQNLETLTWLSMNFSPASIEIIEPDVLKVEARDLTNWLNDLIAKLHQISAEIRSERGAKEHMIVGMNQLIKNSILLALESGSKTTAELSKTTGIVGEQLADFTKHLVEKEKIVQEGDSYRLA